MVQYRRRKKVGPFRFTVSQRGISTSFGAGPFRISKGADGKVRRTIRIPGTGIYDTKVVNRRPRKPASRSGAVMPPNPYRPTPGPPPAGWYRDPGGGAFRRYWDRDQWTPATDEQPSPHDAATSQDEPESADSPQWSHPGVQEQVDPAPPLPRTYSDQPYIETGQNVDPDAPYGRDPVTGKPLSDKLGVTAGVLQLFLGTFGVGRFYIGSKVIGGCQLGLTILFVVLSNLTASSHTASTLVGFSGLGVMVWAIIDALRMFTRTVTDGQGRKLRRADAAREAFSAFGKTFISELFSQLPRRRR